MFFVPLKLPLPPRLPSRHPEAKRLMLLGALKHGELIPEEIERDPEKTAL